MKPTEAAAAIDAHRQTLTIYAHYDGPPAATPSKPYTVLYPGAGTPTGRCLTGQATLAAVVGRLVCVNNSTTGALKVAQDVVDLFDGWEIDGNLVECSCGPLLTDPDLMTGFRYSVTVELRHDLTR